MILLTFFSICRATRSKYDRFPTIVYFPANHTADLEVVGDLCGKFGFCLCSPESVVCSVARMITFPEPVANGTKFLDLGDNGIISIPTMALVSSLTEVDVNRNSLRTLPRISELVPALATFSAQDNNISVLGENDLAFLSVSLAELDLDGNPIAAVSDGALNNTPNLRKFRGLRALSNCTMVPQSTTDVARLECNCTFGLATDLNRPAFCGL